MDRIIDISKYIPPVTDGTENFDAIVKNENIELNLVNNELNNVFKDQFIEDATENGIKKLENIIKLYPRASDTLEDRRIAVLLKYNMQLPYTYRTLLNKLIALYGVDGFDIELINNEYILNIEIFSSNWNVFSTVIDNLRRILPCNLVINSKIINEVESSLYFGLASISGEIITNYPFAPKDIESNVNVYVSPSHYIESEVITNYPKEG